MSAPTSSAPVTDRPEDPAAAPARRPPRHPVLRTLGVLVLVLLAITGYSIGGSLTRAGNDPVAARLAEWARDHHMDFAVTTLEKLQYSANAPRTGGTPKGGIPLEGTPAAGASSAPAATGPAPVPHSPTPAPVAVVAKGAPLPNEGTWQTVVSDAGQPAVRVAYVRPDDQHTGYLAALMWLDPKLLRAQLHPGHTQDPPGTWSTPNLIDAAARQTVAAAHNGGFRLNGASRGGYYDEGRVAVPLRDGAASIVIDKDGTIRVGAWNRDVTMGPQVRSVRQNLDLLVDDGRLNQTCADNNSPVWGYTLGNNSYVPRSAFGIRADGALVYVNSPATSVCSIGRLLQAAGVVRGMELDINPVWTIGVYYTHDGSTVIAHKLRPDQVQGANNYYTGQTRDFLAYSLRDVTP